VKKIVDELGSPDSILMGSDYPHPEGIAVPRDFADVALKGLNARQVEQIMYSNGRRMLPK
jgi:predicted TIM-barrel fold metal-dependent hydrolase